MCLPHAHTYSVPSNRDDHYMLGKKENMCRRGVWQGLSEEISLWIKFNVGWPYKPYQNPTVWACRMYLRQLSSRVLRKLRPQILKNSDPLGVSKTKTSRKPQTPEKLRSLGVLKTQTLNIFQILQLTIDREQPLSLSHLQKRNFVFQKYRLSESSHWQNFDKTRFFWRFVMRPFVRIVTFDEVFKLRGQICWWSLNLFSSKSCQKNKIKANHAGI